MAQLTPTHVSILQKIFAYFEIAASVAGPVMEVIPETHVQTIGKVFEQLTGELQGAQSATTVLIGGVATPIPINKEIGTANGAD